MTVATPDALSSAPGPSGVRVAVRADEVVRTGLATRQRSDHRLAAPSRMVASSETLTVRPACAADASARPSTYETANTGTGCDALAGSEPSRDQSTYRFGSFGALVRIAAGSKPLFTIAA